MSLVEPVGESREKWLADALDMAGEEIERLQAALYAEQFKATEIERLRAEVERLRHYRDVVQRCVGADKEIARLRAEVERQRKLIADCRACNTLEELHKTRRALGDAKARV